MKTVAGFPAARALDSMPASYLDTWAPARVGDAEHGPEAQGGRGLETPAIAKVFPIG